MDLLHIVIVFSPGFNFDFLSSSKEIGWEDHLQYDPFSVK